MTPPQSGILSPESGKNADVSPLAALEAFLEENPPNGLGVVEAALARPLAAAIDSAPGYAVGRLMNTLIVLLDRRSSEDELIDRAHDSLSWLREAS